MEIVKFIFDKTGLKIEPLYKYDKIINIYNNEIFSKKDKSNTTINIYSEKVLQKSYNFINNIIYVKYKYLNNIVYYAKIKRLCEKIKDELIDNVWITENEDKPAKILLYDNYLIKYLYYKNKIFRATRINIKTQKIVSIDFFNNGVIYKNINYLLKRKSLFNKKGELSSINGPALIEYYDDLLLYVNKMSYYFCGNLMRHKYNINKYNKKNLKQYNLDKRTNRYNKNIILNNNLTLIYYNKLGEIVLDKCI